MKTSTARCPDCSPRTAHKCWDYIWSNESVKCLWVCRNCGHERPARTRTQPTEPNRAQAQAIERLKKSGWLMGKMAFIGSDYAITASRGIGYAHESAFLRIGPRGRVTGTVYRALGDDRVLKTKADSWMVA